MHIRTGQHSYYVYLISSVDRSRLEAGTTGDLESLVLQLAPGSEKNDRSKRKGLCDIVLHWENFEDALKAVARREEIEKWTRRKQEALIDQFNPEWKSLNEQILSTSVYVYTQVNDNSN